MIKEQLKSRLGEELLKVAYLEVFWPEGSKKGSVELAYLLTNQQNLDMVIETNFKPVKVGKKKEKRSSSNSRTNNR